MRETSSRTRKTAIVTAVLMVFDSTVYCTKQEKTDSGNYEPITTDVMRMKLF